MGKCKYCDFQFTSSEDLLIHLNKEHWKCAICNSVEDYKDYDKDDYLAICQKCRDEGRSVYD